NSAPLRRDSWGRLECAFRTLPNLLRLPIAIAPQAVSPVSRGQEEQRSASETWRLDAHVRQWKGRYVLFFHSASDNRNGPQVDPRVYNARGNALSVSSGCQSGVLFQAQTHAARRLGLGIERPQPRSGAVFIVRDEQNRLFVDRCGERDIGVEMCELLWLSTVWRNAPQVHLVRGRTTAHKEDPTAIFRPDRKMVVQPGLVLHDLALIVAVVIRHEGGVAWFPRVIDQTGAIGRPGHLGNSFVQEIVLRSANQRPQHEPPGFRPCAPDLRAVG